MSTNGCEYFTCRKHCLGGGVPLQQNLSSRVLGHSQDVWTLFMIMDHDQTGLVNLEEGKGLGCDAFFLLGCDAEKFSDMIRFLGCDAVVVSTIQFKL